MGSDGFGAGGGHNSGGPRDTPANILCQNPRSPTKLLNTPPPQQNHPPQNWMERTSPQPPKNQKHRKMAGSEKMSSEIFTVSTQKGHTNSETHSEKMDSERMDSENKSIPKSRERVRNVDLIWLLQASTHLLLLTRDWLHQCPNKKNNLSEEKYLAQWDGRAENRHQCSDTLNGWMGETGFSQLLQPLCWLSPILCTGRAMRDKTGRMSVWAKSSNSEALVQTPRTLCLTNLFGSNLAVCNSCVDAFLYALLHSFALLGVLPVALSCVFLRPTASRTTAFGISECKSGFANKSSMDLWATLIFF